MINAHGGKLINRVTSADPSGLFSIEISADLANDVENIADGIFSPLEGFLDKQNFESVIEKGRLDNGTAWTIPTVLDVDDEISKKMKEAGDVLLKNPDGIGIAILHVEEIFSYDKQKTSSGVYGTNDVAHPGVAKTNNMKDVLVGGKIDFIQRQNETEIRKHRMTPAETRKSFMELVFATPGCVSSFVP